MVWQETVNLPTYVTIGSIPITSTKFNGACSLQRSVKSLP